MNSVPLIPKPKDLPNPNVLPLITELFQDEFGTEGPSKNVTKNILTSLRHIATPGEENETFRSVEFLESLAKRKDNIMEYSDNVLKAYKGHEEYLQEIRKVEKNVFESQLSYFDSGLSALEHRSFQEFLSLKRQPLFKALNEEYVKKFKLLQGDAGLPPPYLAKIDFRVRNYRARQKRLLYLKEDFLLQREPSGVPCRTINVKKEIVAVESVCAQPEIQTLTRRKKTKKKDLCILEAEPKVLLFTDYSIGDVYVAEINVKNIFSRGVRFQLKPTCPEGPFKVTIHNKNTTKIQPGLRIKLIVEFTPNSLDNVAEDIYIMIEDGHKLLIPLVAYLEPPVLKTHKEIDEFTRTTSEKIVSSYIECGACFSGDTKVTKIRFQCFRGCGEFFIMSSDNWNRSHINNMTSDNVLEIPPFKVYPVFFKVEKNEIIELFVEFSPKFSGMHVENILMACNNGEVRSLDILADAVGWHSYYFSFQDSLQKEFPVNTDDDIKVKYYLNLNDTSPNGKVEKVFCVSNNSNMAFDFQWKVRDANISPNPDKYMKLSKCQIKIDPESGTFEPNSIWEFQVIVTFNDAEVGEYRTVLSLYVLNLPYQCIEEDNTIIQPTGLVRNVYTQSVYGDETPIPSAELLSLQGTYESLQESIKSYVEYQTKTQTSVKTDFCKSYCIPNPELCAKPLKKSKTFFNIGDSIDDEVFSCVCRMKPSEAESVSESCTSNIKANESTAPKTEVIWDFVDILVDELEIWVEVIGPRVVLNPSVIELCGPIMINEPALIKQVEIFNYNRTPISCKWVKHTEDMSCRGETLSKDNVLVSLLFAKSGIKDKEKVSEKQSERNSENECCGALLPIVKRLAIKPKRHNTCIESITVTTEPRSSFTVPGVSQFSCYIGIAAKEPGPIKEELCLYVNDGELVLNLIVLGNARKKHFSLHPDILDFGVVKQTTRNHLDFKVVNESSLPLFWHIKEFKFDFDRGEFHEFINPHTGVLKILKNENSSAVREHYLDTKDIGMKCSLLEVQSHCLETNSFDNQYVMVLGQVKTPKLQVYARRFHNAILAPPGMMHVGVKINTCVILENVGYIDTSFSWGVAFGCHGRNIKVEFFPQASTIKKHEKLVIEVHLTPLDEGIINHCYIPCFFSRKVDPLILSIVGIVENLNVTFEIIDYPQQAHVSTTNFLKSPDYHTVLRVPWPIKIIDLTLGKKFIMEDDILNMRCHCAKIGKRARRISKSIKQEIDAMSAEKSFSTKISFSRSSDLGIDDCNASEKSSLQKYIPRHHSFESLRGLQSEIEFLNVPFRTPISRQFVIRNETPLPTTFLIRVARFSGKSNPEKRLSSIKDRVYGHENDTYQKLLTGKAPLVIDVNPTKGELLGLDAVCVTITVYGNTWGEYRDHVLCQIKGIQFFRLKMFIQIVGHPIHFPMFRTDESVKPVLRFPPLYSTCQPSVKKVKVINRSAVSLTAQWIVLLTQPSFKDDETDDITDSLKNVESSFSTAESTKSIKNYIPKNSSGTISAFKNLGQSEISDASEGAGSAHKTSVSLNEKKVSVEVSASVNSNASIDDLKSESQQLSPFGHVDNHIFMVEPKEMEFEPFEEKIMTITFKPGTWKNESYAQIYKAVLTCCVRLNPEDEKLSRVFYRPCGMNFVSEVLEFNAITEIPLTSFEILKGDLRFTIDANAVIKSPLKYFAIQRVFKIQNRNQKQISFKVEVVPGVVFRIKSIGTLHKLYKKYNPDVHEISIEAGEVCELELECLVTYRDVVYAYEQLKLSRRESHTSPSEKTGSKSKGTSDADRKDRLKEPWLQYFACSEVDRPGCTIENFKLEHRDSYEININRMSSKSNSICYDIYGKNYYGEMEGEYWEIPPMEEFQTTFKTPQHIIHAKEDINLIQTGILTQTLQAELRLSFPSIKVSPSVCDFGNVYIGDSAVRYSTVVNLTGFTTEFKLKPRPGGGDFLVKPLSGTLQPTNFNSNIGKTITIDFKPTQPGYFREIFYFYCNSEMEFDFCELFVSGFGTWNEKYKYPKFETITKLKGAYN